MTRLDQLTLNLADGVLTDVEGRELQALLADPSYAQRASYVSERLKQENGPRCAADLIEQTMSDRLKAVEESAYAFGN